MGTGRVKEMKMEEEEHIENLRSANSDLQELVERLQKEIKQKDNKIQELNNELEVMYNEKDRLQGELWWENI